MSTLNNLTLKEGEVLNIDGVDLKSVTHYELIHSADQEAELTVKMMVKVQKSASV